MPATPTLSESPAVQRQYLAQLALTDALNQVINNLWQASDPLEDQSKFRGGLVAVAGEFSPMAASIATDFYRDVRAEAGVAGSPNLRLVDPIPASKVEAGVDWAFRSDAEEKILARVEAAMQKAIADIGREQTVAAVAGDEYAIGYRRVPRPSACSFCIVMAIRKSTRTGRAVDASANARKNAHDPNVEHYGVYKSRAAAGQMPNDINRFHNNCHCVVEPVFFPITAQTGWLHDMERLYDSSTANSRSGDRLNDFRRALSAERRGITPPTPTAPAVVTPAANSEQIKNLLNLFAA